jgi:hypothetical protein
VQWHIISEGDGKAAQDLIHLCSAYTSTIRDAVLVFQQGYWSADYNLWQAVQKVGL